MADDLAALRSFCARTGIEMPNDGADFSMSAWARKVERTLDMLAHHLEALEDIVLRLKKAA